MLMDKNFFGKHLDRHEIQIGECHSSFMIDARWPDDRRSKEYEYRDVALRQKYGLN